MTPRQLSLTEPPTIEPKARKQETYRGVSVTVKDERDPRKRGHVALDAYTGKPNPPRWMICHAEDAAAIGAEVDGVLVVATGKARGLYLLGPVEV